jgi:hypothetical protein
VPSAKLALARGNKTKTKYEESKLSAKSARAQNTGRIIASGPVGVTDYYYIWLGGRPGEPI